MKKRSSQVAAAIPAAGAAGTTRRAGAYRVIRPAGAMSARLSIIPNAATPGSDDADDVSQRDGQRAGRAHARQRG
ncbi:hypothetical protein [Streptosporangium sp. NPDC049644]|uniref:hypothetical protein n=1 Tax=Streptosporangium sp. NPDC049644 TaxID=3155507 RepID=UPI003449EA48